MNIRRRPSNRILAIFFLALIVRGGALIYTLNHPEVILQPDSRMYISLARGLTEYGSFSYHETPHRLSADRTPGYPFFLALCLSVAGGSLLAVAFMQAFIDSLSCVLIYQIADRLWQGAGFLSGILASLNLGMITYSLFILNDSLFLFVFLLFLLLIVRFLKTPKWRLSILTGILIGIGALIRPVVLYLPLAILPFLIVYLLIHSNAGLLTACGKVLIMGIAFLLTVFPWLLRNHTHYGTLKLSSQSGEHLLQYIVPSAWQYSKGIPFIDGMKKTSDEFNKRAEKEALDLKNANPFAVSDLQVRLALDYLREEPGAAIAKAWVFGMAKNLFAPAVIDFSYLLNIERPHFFYTHGTTTIARAWNFLKGIKGWFGWAVIGSLALLGLSRVIQIWGLIRLLKRKPWEGLFMVLIVGYFLVISGPVGYAKYRLPFEPILIIILSIGLKEMFSREKQVA